MAFHTCKVIKTWRDPYDRGWLLTKPKEIFIKPGLTVLVGCNGAGKTTILKQGYRNPTGFRRWVKVVKNQKS